ncbi:nitroreductase family protein [Streptomyces sp. NPDC007084]|uniref:nitroreductase family protein n=1 Tax=Streptomyces sp. NPDC007084 TaxID=3154313 RepID=UPI0034539695
MTGDALLSVPEAIRRRRAIRHYRPDPLSAEQLALLVELTMEAPSSFNYQSRSVVVVTDPARRTALAAAAEGQPHPAEAPATLVFVADSSGWRCDHEDIYELARTRAAWNEAYLTTGESAGRDFYAGVAARGLLREYAIKDAVIAATYAMLAAASMGLASSPMNGWDEDEVKKVIGIDGRDDLHIALLVPVGTPAEERRHPGRRPLARNVFLDTFDTSNAFDHDGRTRPDQGETAS